MASSLHTAALNFSFRTSCLITAGVSGDVVNSPVFNWCFCKPILFEPLISTPIKGTKTKEIKKIINKIKQIFNSLFFSKKEKMINIVNANKVIIRCLTKK